MTWSDDTKFVRALEAVSFPRNVLPPALFMSDSLLLRPQL